MEELAAQLGLQIPNSPDIDDYLLLLKSFEAVLNKINDGPDYIHPDLKPQQVATDRQF